MQSSETPNSQHHAELPWYQHELKIREFHQRATLDFQKLSAEFSKIILTYLIILNTGGLGAIPAVAVFLNLDKLTLDEKINFFQWSLICFGIGAICALLSAFAAYLNFQAASGNCAWSARSEIAVFRKLHPIYGANKNFADVINAENETANRAIADAYRWTQRHLWISVSSGLLSLALFVGGCGSLVATVQNSSVAKVTYASPSWPEAWVPRAGQ